MSHGPARSWGPPETRPTGTKLQSKKATDALIDKNRRKPNVKNRVDELQ